MNVVTLVVTDNHGASDSAMLNIVVIVQ